MKNRLKDLRIDRDLSQEELAKKIFCSQRVYSHYENGTRSIPLEVLINLANFYNVSIDYILYRTNNKEINKEKIDN